MYLTTDMLREKNACNYQVTVFEKEWPDGAEITVEAILRAVELELDLDWFARQFLPAPVRKAYNEAMTSAQRAYNEVIAPAQKAYDETIAPTWKAYDEAIVPAWEEDMAPMQEAYNEAIAFAEKAYHKTQVLALYKALKEL